MTMPAIPRPLRRLATPVGAGAAVATVIVVPTILFATTNGSAPGDERTRSRADISLGALAVAAAPRNGYLSGAEFVSAEGRVSFQLPKDTSVTEFAPMKGGYVLSTSDPKGNERVGFATNDGTMTRSWESFRDLFFPSLVVSEDGALGAFASATGKVTVIEDQGRVVTELPPVDGADSIGAPIAVSGRSCHGVDADCVLVVHANAPVQPDGTLRRTWTVSPGRRAMPAATGVGEVRAVAANGYTGGTLKITEDGDGACAGVADAGGSVLWRTCKDRMIAFSPNSKLILASSSAFFGSGDHELTVFDADTGAERLRLKTAKNVGIYEMVWEDESHVLAVVSDWKVDGQSGEHTHKRWAVLRIGIDGFREYAVQPVGGRDDDYDGPLDVPLR